MQRIVIIVVLAAAAYFIYQTIMNYLSAISGSRSAARQDLLQLDELLDVYDLGEWDDHEIELLSRRYEVAQKTELYSYIDYGCFFSIYDEAIMAFAHKEYKENDLELIVIAFHDKRYHFTMKGGIVSMSQKSVQGGEIDLSDGMKLQLGNKTAHIDTNMSSGLMPLSVGNKEIFGIATEDELTKDSGRMLHKLQDYTPEEGAVMKVALSFALANKQV